VKKTSPRPFGTWANDGRIEAESTALHLYVVHIIADSGQKCKRLPFESSAHAFSMAISIPCVEMAFLTQEGCEQMIKNAKRYNMQK